MNATTIVGYTGDADTYCVPCATKRYELNICEAFGMKPTDNEGNEVMPLFPTEECDYQQVCRDCGEEIPCVVIGKEQEEYLMGNQERESKVMEAIRSNSLISKGIARNIASLWHGGMGSCLYQFCSTGNVRDQEALLVEIAECKAQIASNPAVYDPYNSWELDKLEERVKKEIR